MSEIEIKSKIIARIAYDQSKGLLRVNFKNSQVRLFEGVPAAVVKAMVRDVSPGQFYIDHVRSNFRRIAA